MSHRKTAFGSVKFSNLMRVFGKFSKLRVVWKLSFLFLLHKNLSLMGNGQVAVQETTGPKFVVRFSIDRLQFRCWADELISLSRIYTGIRIGRQGTGRSFFLSAKSSLK